MFDDIALYVNAVVPSGGAAPFDAKYVTLATDVTLTNERVLTGTTSQVIITDNGAGSTVVLSLPQNIAITSSPSFAGILYRNGSGNTVTINPPSSFSNYVLTLPTDDGGPSQFLMTDGSGGLSWADITTSIAANRALSNLSGVSINQSLIPGTTLNLGSSSAPWEDIHINRDIVLYEEGTLNVILIKSPSSLASYTLKLPTTAGTNNYVLKTDGTGVTDWVAQTSIAGLANYDLSNLNVPAVNVSIKPGIDDTIDLGSATKTWRKIYTTDGISLQSTVTTPDAIILKSPASIAGYTFTFPQNDGATNDVLTNNDGAGTTGWVARTALGLATKALDNLASVAINTSLLPGSSASIDVGSSSFQFRDVTLARNLVISKNGGASVTIAASTSGSFVTPYTLTLPIDDGAANQVLTTDGSGVLSWTAGTGSGAATVALDNLASVAINTSLLPASNNAIDLGSSSKEFRSAYLKTSLIFQETGAGTHTITIQAPSSLSASYTLTLPVDDGTSNQVLQTDGSGVLSWVTPSSGSGTVNSGTAGRLGLYATSTTAISDVYVQNTHNIDLVIATQASRSANLEITVPNPGNAVTTANILLDSDTNSYTIAGNWTLSNPLLLPVGSVSAPSLTFTGDTDTGIFHPFANQISLTENGIERLNIQNIAVVIVGSDTQLNLPDGTASLPSLTFSSGTQNTGIYKKGTNEIGITCNGSLQVDITSSAFTLSSELLQIFGNADGTDYTLVDLLSGGTGTGTPSTTAPGNHSRVEGRRTLNVSTSPTAILNVNSHGNIAIVTGSNGTSVFCDCISFVSASGVAVGNLGSFTIAGTPATRTYTTGSFQLKLTMGTGTYNVHVTVLGSD